MADPAERIVENEDAYALNAATVDAILAAVEAGERLRLIETLDHLHPADIADLLEQIDVSQRERLIELWGKDLNPEVLSELEEGARDLVLATLTPDQLSSAVQELETDDVVYLVEDMDEPQQEILLDALDDADRVAVEQSLTYDEYSAGRMMQREMVTAPEHWTVGDIIDFMRASDDLPEQFYDIIIVDPALKPVGEVRLGKVMAHPRTVKLSTLMEDEFRTIPVNQSQEDVAYAFNQYHMIQAPVVDEHGRLVGTITIDDAMDVLEDEAEEDMRLLAGVGDEEISDSTWAIAKRRFPWLLVNLLTAVIASIVISLFADTLEAVVALAILMPIVASMGGNAATQTLTVAVRAIATRDLTASNMMRVVRRELVAGTLNGVAFAIIIAIIGMVWFGIPMLGVVLAIAMVGNLAVAGLAGILIPIALDKAGADPALASGTFVTTVTDVVGFMLFLGLASALLL
ncbi:magnesium transporter [Pontivivens insulae]|uniref:Magnesium transporter MgtE n=1 Tax=Pontivivens insulae TaxID=1639689 RepID=A0A2R8A8S7_9RHOB|nr:magnesium transporter [Pontivivens insulae]RED18733.1 Mg2+ transporter MgtE [Pontivivens insulae]SPF28631.1 Magnesium transporter MgtE [Pontivivens insulae]